MRPRWYCWIFLACSTAWAVYDGQRSTWLWLAHQLTDFRASYCAGAAVDVRRNPYLVEPLRSCERKVSGAWLLRGSETVVPSPAPGFVIGLFGLVARLPFGVAAPVWTLAQIVALGLAIWFLSCATRAPPVLVAAVLVLSDGVTSIAQGQLVTLEMLALTGAGVAVARGWWWTAGLCGAATLLEPQVGLPVCIVSAWLLPRARTPVAVGIVAAGIGSVLALGPAQNVQYIRAVVPAELVSETAYQAQYSLTYVLQYAGVSMWTALLVGLAQYVAMIGLAVPVAHVLMRRYGLAFGAVFVPAAFAVTGGCSLRLPLICCALPLALALRPVAGSARVAAPLTVATALLAIPWAYPYDSKPLFVATAVVLGVVLSYAGSRAWRWTVPLMVVALAVLNVLENWPPVIEPIGHVAWGSPHALAEWAWRDYVADRATRNGAHFATKMLTWSGLLFLVAVAVECATRSTQFFVLRRMVRRVAGGVVLAAIAPTLAEPSVLGAPSSRWLTYQERADKNAVLTSTNWRVKWTAATQARVNGGLALVDTTIYFGSNDGNAYAFDARTGALRWLWPVGNATMTAPIVADGLVIFGTGTNAVLLDTPRKVVWGRRQGDAVVALDAERGFPVWRFETVGEDMPSPVLLTIGRRDELVFANGDDHVYALDARTGKLLWKRTTFGVDTMSSLAATNDMVVGLSNLGQLYYNETAHDPARYRLRSRTWALDALRRRFVWMTPFGNSDCSPAIADGLVFVETDARLDPSSGTGPATNTVAALDLRTGSIRWSYTGPPGPWSGAGTNEEAVAGVYAGGTYFTALPYPRRFVALRAATGRLLWSITTSAPVKMGAVAYRGRLYFGDTGGTLYVVAAENGAILRRTPFAEAFDASPPVIDGRTLYVANGSRVYALPLDDTGAVVPDGGPT